MDKKSTIKLACNMIIASERMDRIGKIKESKILLDNSLSMIKKSSFIGTLMQELAGQLPKTGLLKTFNYKALNHLNELSKLRNSEAVLNYLATNLEITNTPDGLVRAIVNARTPNQIYSLLKTNKLLNHPDFLQKHYTPLAKTSLAPIPIGFYHGLQQNKKEKQLFDDEKTQIEQKPESEYNFY